MATRKNKKSSQKKELDLTWVLKYLRDGKYPSGLNFSEKRMVRKRAERFCYWKDDLYYLGTPTDQSLGKKTRRVLLTEKERLEKVEQCHVDIDGTHLGLERTAENITSQYHWNGIYKFIKQFIRRCQVCLERHPKLLGKRKGDNGSDVSNGEDTDSGGEDEDKASGSKVDLRLFGPYQVVERGRYILTGVDIQSHWVEAYVLDDVSSDTLARSLLQMICKYGQMSCVSMSEPSDLLVEALHSSLAALKTDSEINLTIGSVTPEQLPSLNEFFEKARNLMEDFIEKNPSNWPEQIDFCLLPLRLAKQKKQSGSKSAVSIAAAALTIEEEVNQAAEALISVGQSGPSQLATPLTPAGEDPRGIVTRSRTGRTKPKTLYEDDYEVSTPKRKAATDSPAAKKRMKLDESAQGTSVIDISSEFPMSKLDTSSSEVEVSVTHGSTKKTVELDDYYKSIKMYVSGDGYPEASSASFKRLIRDQARNYMLKDGELYHEIGARRDLKKVVMTKDERLKLLTQTHLKSSSKGQMLQSLDSYHWKGKLIDCEAFLLACPHCDKVDQNKLKDSTFKNMGEAKRQLLFDRFDTYQEISNYLVYDVFSDDETSKRLEHLQRQMKNFKMENDKLVHYTGTSRHDVLITAADRLTAITEAHLRKGTHSDATSTYMQLAEKSIWFGMKFDVKIFVNYCCTSENKHLLDRYFQFREYHMKQPLSQEVLNTSEDLIEGEQKNPEIQTIEVQDVVPEEEEQTVIEELPQVVEVLPEETPDVSEVTVENVETTEASSEEVMPPESTTVVTEIGEEQLHQQMLAGGSMIAPDGTMIDQPSTILVKLTEDGQTIIMRDDGTGHARELHGSEEMVVVTKVNSDDVTNAAVKSILTDHGNGTMVTQLYTGTIPQTSDGSHVVIEQIHPPQKTQADEVGEGEIGEVASGTAEEGTNTDYVIEEGEDSDSWIYGTDEEEEEQVERGHPVLESYMKSTDKKPVVPRQHFKCSQCNKIFYGPLKFKMHMYKHTGQKPFPCSLCNKKYTNKKSLVLHQKIHSGELPFLCTLCGKRCASRLALKSHLKCHDSDGGGFPAKCDVCDRVFSRKHLMERHKLHKHTNLQTEFKCTECTKVFSHQRSLKRHFMSSHLNIKNHLCGLCGKSFYRKEYLTGHLIQHGGAVAEGLTPRKPKPSTFKPRPSVFRSEAYERRVKVEGEEEEEFEELNDEGRDEVQRIILTQDENGQLRVVDMATEREVKRMLEAQGLSRGEAGETMVVHIEEPSGEPQVVHVEHTEEQVVEVPLEEHSYIEYQQVDEDKPQEFIINETDGKIQSGSQFVYTSSAGDVSVQGNQELIYGQPAVQYEVECVGDVGDEEALSAINLLAQASAQQYENVISQI